jgi:hypothetical protein
MAGYNSRREESTTKLDESKYFIEWTAAKADFDKAAV